MVFAIWDAEFVSVWVFQSPSLPLSSCIVPFMSLRMFGYSRFDLYLHPLIYVHIYICIYTFTTIFGYGHGYIHVFIPMHTVLIPASG